MRNNNKLLALCLTLTFIFPATAADGSLGIWTNKEETHVYALLGGSDFRFWGQKGEWLKDSQRYKYTPGKTDGAWQQGESLCWAGENKQQLGNLMIYADTLQCCLMAQFLGSKLVLSEVWKKGTDELGICENRVLTRAKGLPAE